MDPKFDTVIAYLSAQFNAPVDYQWGGLRDIHKFRIHADPPLWLYLTKELAEGLSSANLVSLLDGYQVPRRLPASRTRHVIITTDVIEEVDERWAENR